MAKRFAVTLQAVSSAELPGIGKEEIAGAIALDLNARGIFLESILIEEIKEEAA